MAVLYLPLVLIALCYAVYYYFTRTFNYWKKRNVAGPEPIPFFGNLKESALRQKNLGVVMQEFYEMFPNEKVVGVYRMTTPCLLIRDLDIIKHIMIKDFELFADRGVEFSKQGLGQNLFHADGDTWRALRSRFSPMFTSGKLKNMFYLMSERANTFLEYLNKECQIKREHEIHSLVQKYTIATISACAFGVNIDTLNEKLEELKRIDQLILTPTYAAELDMMYPGLLKKLNLSLMPAPVQVFFKNLVNNIIIQRNGKPTGRHDFMDLILELRQMGEINSSKFGDSKTILDITDDVIAAQAFVFYVAGYETSATTMSYLLYQLALNPDIQNKLIAEIDEIIKANDGQVTYESIKDMKYLHKVFDETLRMHSIVEPLQRKAKIDFKIPGTDLVIKKNQIVLVSSRGIHYDEKHYPKPEVFDPERFDTDVAGTRHPCAYLPFGIGQRNCVGKYNNIQ